MANQSTPLQTERLTLRPFQLQGVSDAYGYASDTEWARYLTVPQPYEPRDAEGFVARQVLLDRAVHPSWALVLGQTVVQWIQSRVPTPSEVRARPTPENCST